jgi:hypothetical protein
MRAHRFRALAAAAAACLLVAACGDDGADTNVATDGSVSRAAASRTDDAATDAATGSTVTVTVVGVRGYRGGDLAGVVATASDGTVVGGFSANVDDDEFTTTRLVRTPGDSGAPAGSWPDLGDDPAILTPGDYVVMLWLDTGLGGYTRWLPLNTDGQGLAGCVHRFQVTDDTTEVVISGDVRSTGYLGVCGSALDTRDGTDVSNDVLAAALSCLPMDADGWARSDDLAGVANDVLLASDGEVLVALGAGSDGLGVHHSTDGITWTPGDGIPPMTLGGPVVDLAGGPEGFVAVGATGASSPTSPVVAFSPDGARWERIEPESLPRSWISWFSGVFAGPDGFVIAGTDTSAPGSSTFVWYSDDGRTWVETDLDLGDGPVAVTSTTTGWMLLRADDADGETDASSEVWTSEDGTAWTEVDTVRAPPARALFRSFWATPLVADDDSVVLVLAGAVDDDPGPRSPTVWVSNDGGRTWTERTVWADPGRAGFQIHDTAVTGSGLLLAGYQDRPGSVGVEFVHHSSDGVSWEHCWTDPVEVRAIESFGDAVVAVTGTGTVLVWNEP